MGHCSCLILSRAVAFLLFNFSCKDLKMTVFLTNAWNNSAHRGLISHEFSSASSISNCRNGDIIQIYRWKKLYSHISIFWKGESVQEALFIDLANEPGTKKERCKVSCRDAEPVIGYSSFRIYNWCDHIYNPYPPEIVINRARFAIGKEGYNLRSGNCEHFVCYCRYGIIISWQSIRLESIIFGSSIFITTGIVLKNGHPSGVNMAIASSLGFVSATFYYFCAMWRSKRRDKVNEWGV